MAGLVVVVLCFRIPTPDRGLWERGYIANLPMPTYAAWRGDPLGTAHLPGHDFPAVSPHDAGGIGAYLDTGCPAPQVPRALETLERLPLRWARTEIPWAGVEPEPGRWEWSRWDRVVNGLHRRQFRVLGMLCYWTGGIVPYSDEAIARFGKYAEATARRYAGQVDHWEVWNEPNSETFWKSTPERYVRLLQAAFEGVKRGNPRATVIGGSLSGVDLVYLRNILDLGAGRWMDALSVHPYTFGWAPESTRLLQELRGAAMAMQAAGKSPGIWVTEIGTSTWHDDKAAELTERYLLLMSQSRAVEAWFWFALYLPEPSAYALYRTDWSPRSTALVLERTSRRLRVSDPLGSAVKSDLTPPWGAGHPAALAGAQLWCFRRGGQFEVAAWTGGDRSQLASEVAGLPKGVEMGRAPVWFRLPVRGGARE